MKSKFLFLLYTLLFTSLEIFSFFGKAQASDAVILRYGIFQESVSVPELSTFARGGELSSSLKNYLNMANQRPETLKMLLTQEIPVDGVFLYRVLNSFPGEILLDSVGEVVKTPSGRASRESLRSALVSSALPDRQISLVEIIENYPTSEVYLEGDRLSVVYNSIRSALNFASRLKL
jgi:hypothetical protein